jgi:hypothetical protein
VGIGTDESLSPEGDEWVADSPLGRISIRFAERNELGVLDHWVTLPDGATEYNPVRADLETLKAILEG